MKCELCGESTDKLYEVPFCDDVDYDEYGPHLIYARYNVCAACVPEEMVDVITEDV